MGVHEAKAFLKERNFLDRFIETGESSKTVALAAKALGCEERDIVKTMAFLVEEEPILILLAGDVKIDNKKYKEVFRKKAKMIEPSELEDLIGHPMGGVCPFGIKKGVRVYFDESLKRLETLYPAGGSGHSAVRLNLEELSFLVEASFIDVSKEME